MSDRDLIEAAYANLDLIGEERVEKGLECRFEVTDGDALVDQQSLELVKHRRVAEVGVAPVDAPRHHDSDGRFAALHHPRLDR